MSLLTDIEDWYKSTSYPPEGPDLDEKFIDGKFVDQGTNTEQVEYEVVDSAARWGNSIQVVYKRGEELVAVSDVEPATEMQSWGDYGSPEIYPVRAVEVTRTKYVKVD